MPYGDLSRPAVQRFAAIEDLKKSDCSIEEMEEYEPHIANGDVVYAGVDYERILRVVEAEADVILWDGGNNDFPFFEPDLEIVLLDPHRAGHERTYFPGEVNLLRADVLLINKLDTADAEKVAEVRRTIHAYNPSAVVIDAGMPVSIEDPRLIRGKRALVVEDGPTLTHGGMSFGAGVLAARKFGARELVDPRSRAVGSIRQVFLEYPHIMGTVLPAMGYGPEQMRELEETISKTDCDVVVIATPVDLRRIIRISQPTCRVRYGIEEIGRPTLQEVLHDFIRKVTAHA